MPLLLQLLLPWRYLYASAAAAVVAAVTSVVAGPRAVPRLRAMRLQVKLRCPAEGDTQRSQEETPGAAAAAAAAAAASP